MTKDRYEKLMGYWHSHPANAKRVALAAKLFPAAIFMAYPLTALYLVLTQNSRIWLFLTIPALNFVTVTALRKILDFQRPYTVYGFSPLVGNAEKHGQSFPSRHSASAVVIACACTYINPVYGALMFVAATVVLLTRILSGAHFTRDVLVGALISLLFSVVFLIA